METRFDDIRPYIQPEIAPAMQRIANSEYLLRLANFVFPSKTLEEVKEILQECTSTHDFQTKIMYHFNNQVTKETTTKFSYSGIENLDTKKTYLFVSNHRDIVLDSSLLQQLLHFEGFKTSEITFGSNLMSSPLIIDIGKSNKMFKVERSKNPRDLYSISKHLSEYIRYALTKKGESIWIAQRNGRTKDGNDITDQGLIKMFCMSGNKTDLTASLEELHIVPVAISYQWEPCDFFKTRELYMSRNNTKYVKQKDEDLTSVLTGITQAKGDVHIALCEPLRKEELQQLSDKDFHKKVATFIDQRIYNCYKLHDTNYIAHDILSGSHKHASFYNAEAKGLFLNHLNKIIANIEGDPEIISGIFLGIYANPVCNKPTIC